MKRRRLILFGALALLVVGVVALWPRGPKEPVYQGKPLLQWLNDSYYCNDASAQVKLEAATRAVKASGTNALPFLLSCFVTNKPGAIHKINESLDRLGMDALQFKEPRDSLPAASYGIHLLGPEAAPALPVFARHLEEHSGDGDTGEWAASAMSGIGEPAFPFLVKAAASTNVTIHFNGIQGLQTLANTTEKVVSPLMALLKDANPQLRRAAAFALRHTSFKKEQVVASLAAVLSDADSEVQQCAVNSLLKLRAVAKPAIPQLLALMNTTNASLALMVSNTVHQIDPAALPR